jgi:hypothetical protein
MIEVVGAAGMGRDNSKHMPIQNMLGSEQLVFFINGVHLS